MAVSEMAAPEAPQGPPPDYASAVGAPAGPPAYPIGPRGAGEAITNFHLHNIFPSIYRELYFRG